MPYLTSTNTLNNSVTAHGSLVGDVLFNSVTISTTISATPGETITLLASSDLGVPTANCNLSYVPVPNLTITEYDAYLQAPDGKIWTTLNIDSTPTANLNLCNPPSRHTPFVFKSSNSGWASWSASQRAGLLSGVICTVVLFAFFFWCCYRRQKIWFSPGTHGAPPVETWQQSQLAGHPGYGYYQPPQNLYTGWGLVPYTMRGGGGRPAAAAAAGLTTGGGTGDGHGRGKAESKEIPEVSGKRRR